MGKMVKRLVIAKKVFDCMAVTTQWEPERLDIVTYVRSSLPVAAVWDALNFEYMGLKQVTDLFLEGEDEDGRQVYRVEFSK